MMTTQYKKCRIVIFSLLIIYALINTISIFTNFYEHSIKTRGFLVTEFLVNYRAGYVRRGLIGEALLAFSSLTGLDARWIIVPTCIIAFIAVIYLIFYLCKKNSCCTWIMMLLLFSPYAWHGLLRKDYMIFLLVAAILYSITNKRLTFASRICITVILYVFAINIHECIFFMIAPFLSLYIIKSNMMSSFSSKCIIAVVSFFVPMILITLCKGSQEQAQVIHDSWIPYFGDDFGITPSGTIQSLTWSSEYAVQLHLKLNFLSKQYLGFVHGWMVMPCLLFGLLYITPNLTLPSWIKVRKLKENRNRFTFILCFQLISLLPMFTVLSCDVSRITSYWIISSVFIYTVVPQQDLDWIISGIWRKFAISLNSLIFHKNSAIISTVFLFFTGIPMIGYSFIEWCASTPVICYLLFVKKLLSSCVAILLL